MRGFALKLISVSTFALAIAAGCPPTEEPKVDPPAEGEGEGEGEGEAVSCANYCASVTANCTGGSAQYTSEDDCVAFCEAESLGWPVGTADEAGAGENTLGCRQYHAGAAANDDHCDHAGPAGGGVCGSYCDVYCDAAMGNCSGGNELYASRSACLDACEGLPDDGNVNDADGNTVQCRIYHLGAAAGDPDGHCAHGSASGAGVCGSWCDAYCGAAMANCTDANALYADEGACQAACADMPDNGDLNDADGNTVQCRVYHLGAAAGDPATHCEHGGASGANVCGTWCDVYCSLMETNCPGTYASAATCSAVCQGLPDDGNIDDDTGDTVQCRIYHASAAAEDAHCTHASEFSTASTCQ